MEINMNTSTNQSIKLLKTGKIIKPINGARRLDALIEINGSAIAEVMGTNEKVEVIKNNRGYLLIKRVIPDKRILKKRVFKQR